MENTKTVYSVDRYTSSTSHHVGDFDTLEAARLAMVRHYQVNPKRGNLRYSITEEEIGNGMRSYTMFQSHHETWPACKLATA
jgi:hypothetical protein